jgi:hypothetical protein
MTTSADEAHHQMRFVTRNRTNNHREAGSGDSLREPHRTSGLFSCCPNRHRHFPSSRPTTRQRAATKAGTTTLCGKEEKVLGVQKAPGSCPYCGGGVAATDVRGGQVGALLPAALPQGQAQVRLHHMRQAPRLLPRAILLHE